MKIWSKGNFSQKVCQQNFLWTKILVKKFWFKSVFLSTLFKGGNKNFGKVGLRGEGWKREKQLFLGHPIWWPRKGLIRSLENFILLWATCLLKWRDFQMTSKVGLKHISPLSVNFLQVFLWIFSLLHLFSSLKRTWIDKKDINNICWVENDLQQF